MRERRLGLPWHLTSCRTPLSYASTFQRAACSVIDSFGVIEHLGDRSRRSIAKQNQIGGHGCRRQKEPNDVFGRRNGRLADRNPPSQCRENDGRPGDEKRDEELSECHDNLTQFGANHAQPGLVGAQCSGGYYCRQRASCERTLGTQAGVSGADIFSICDVTAQPR